MNETVQTNMTGWKVLHLPSYFEQSMNPGFALQKEGGVHTVRQI